MRGWKGLSVAVGLMLLVASASVLGARACYEDVTVRGCGAPWMNQRLPFLGMGDEVSFYLLEFSAGYPVFGIGSYASGCEFYVMLGFYEVFGRWVLVGEIGCDCGILYVAGGADGGIPSTGWSLTEWYDDTGECEFLPEPRVSGGGPCSGLLVPAGAAGFLDRGFPEGEEPPVVGELLVSAIYEAGEIITGCCRVESSAGHAVEPSYLTLTWYAVTVGDEFDLREPIDSKILHCDDGAFCFEIDTAGWSPGYYDIRIGIPGEDREWIRVEVAAPSG